MLSHDDPSHDDESFIELTPEQCRQVRAGLKWEGHRMSDNVHDMRGCTPLSAFINPGSGVPASCNNPRLRN